MGIMRRYFDEELMVAESVELTCANQCSLHRFKIFSAICILSVYNLTFVGGERPIKRSRGMSDKTILLVEDNPDDVTLTLRALKKNNLLNEVVVARDGVEALDFLFSEGSYAGRNPEHLPELILLDLKLPKVDGLEVLKRIRASQLTKLLPVVILTSSNEQSDIISGYELGVNSYIRKPVDFEQFIEAVRQLGLYWLVLNQTPQL